MAEKSRISIRLDLAPRGRIGPGKIRLLELIEDQGSISAAARAMGMSYRRAWMIVDSLNSAFPAGVVNTHHGGKRGGGAQLTSFGEDLIRRYRHIEAEAQTLLLPQVTDFAPAAISGSDDDATTARVDKATINESDFDDES